MSTEQSSRSMEDFAACRRQLQPTLPGRDHNWLRQIRDRGVQRFAETGYPGERDEDWRYVNLRPLLKRSFLVPEPAVEALQPRQLEPLRIPGLDTIRLVFVDGIHAPALGEGTLPDGLRIDSLSELLDQQSAADIEEHLGRLVPSDSHGFNAMNSALIRDGAVIRIASAAAVETCIELLYLDSGTSAEVHTWPRNLVIADAGSRCRILERHVSLGDGATFCNGVTEITAGNGARIEYLKLHEDGDKGFNISSTFIRQQAESDVRWHTLVLGGQTVRNEIQTRLCEPGAVCDIKGLYLGRGRQGIDNFVRVYHDAPDCRSNEYFKGVMDDRSRAAFPGEDRRCAGCAENRCPAAEPEPPAFPACRGGFQTAAGDLRRRR